MSSVTRSGFVYRTARGRFRVDWRAVAPESLFTTSRLLLEIQKRAKLAGGLMLDIGCGTKPYRQLFADRVTRHVGVDVPGSLHGRQAIDAFSTATDLPFRAGSFDFVLCTEVLEHVPDPHRAYEEIARVLKPGGHALITTPFMYRVHEQPYDFFRYTPFSHAELATRAGLQVEEISPRGGYFSVLFDTLLKGLSLGAGGLGSVASRLARRRINLRLHPFTRFVFAMIQYPIGTLLAREDVKSDTYTLGYVVVVRKPVHQDRLPA